MTQFSVTDEQLGQLAKRWWELFRRFKEGTLNFDSIMGGLQLLIEGKQVVAVEGGQMRGLFTSPEDQLNLALGWNKEYGWGIPEEAFTNLGPAPFCPPGGLCVVGLDISLGTVQQTFEEAWRLTAAQQPDSWRWVQIETDPDHLSLVEGIQFQSQTLTWRILDLLTYWDKKDGLSSADIRQKVQPKELVHSAGLWLTATSPKFVQAMDGKELPFMWLPGYKVTMSDHEQWTRVLEVNWLPGTRRVKMFAHYAGSRGGRWSVPVFRESN